MHWAFWPAPALRGADSESLRLSVIGGSDETFPSSSVVSAFSRGVSVPAASRGTTWGRSQPLYLNKLTLIGRDIECYCQPTRCLNNSEDETQEAIPSGARAASPFPVTEQAIERPASNSVRERSSISKLMIRTCARVCETQTSSRMACLEPQPLTAPETAGYLVGSLRLFTRIVEGSLHDEYCFTEEVVREWVKSLRLLLRAGEVFDERVQASKLPADTKSQCAERLANFNKVVHQALAYVEGERPKASTPEDKIYGALSHVSGARYDLSIWQDQLAAHSTDLVEEVSARVAEEAKHALADAFSDLQNKLIEGDDYQRCTASRWLYHVTYFTAVVHPSLWSAEIHNRIVRLNENLAKCMARGQALESVLKRLASLRAVTPMTLPKNVANPQSSVQS